MDLIFIPINSMVRYNERKLNLLQSGPPRGAVRPKDKTTPFVILICLIISDDLTHQGKASWWEWVNCH